MTPLRKRMIEDMTLAGLVPRTQDVYIQAVRRLAAHYMRSPDLLSEAEVRAFLQGLRHFSLAESLGGVESLVAHPATMTHASMDPQARLKAGIGDTLLRLSVGVEAAEDLVGDLTAGLDRALHVRQALQPVGT